MPIACFGITLFYSGSGEKIFLESCPVIYFADGFMLLQETVNSFEEVMQTKLKVKLCISQSSMQSLYIAKESCF